MKLALFALEVHCCPRKGKMSLDTAVSYAFAIPDDQRERKYDFRH